jgi:deazaflavin-dependent oxidoreductase (nitroreductase family)
MAAAGRVAWLTTHGRVTGQDRGVAVGFAEEPGGSVLVAAGRPDTDWALNLQADPSCTVEIGGRSFQATATPLRPDEHARVIGALILRYGTPAERLGRGPSFRLVPVAI